MPHYSALKRKLERSAHAPLVELIDWENTPRRSTLKILFFGVFAFVPVAAMVAAGLWVQHNLLGLSPGFNSPEQVAATIVTAPIMFAAFWATTSAFRAARAEISKFPEHALFSSSAPILYLREFRDENEEWSDFVARSEGRRWVIWLHRAFAGMRNWTLERKIVSATAKIGPMLALRDPLQRRQPGEARRLQIKGPRWQEAVNHLLPDVRLVVLIFGAGQSVSWEASRVIEQTRLPVFVWMPALPAELPSWLNNPLERGQWKGDGPGDPKASYLFYFDENRHVESKSIANWFPIAAQIKRILRAKDITATPNPHCRPIVSPVVGALERGFWLLPYLGLFILGATAFYFLVPGLADSIDCIVRPDPDRCYALTLERVREGSR